MAKNKPFLNPDLNLRDLASEISIPPRHLSQVLNEYFNQNFFDFISRYRIEECKKMLLTSSGRKTVLEIMYTVGFNSKSAFNKAFKKHTGITPSQFKKNLAQ